MHRHNCAYIETIVVMTITEFTKKCRELQGKYREAMGEPMGNGPRLNSPNKQINMLVDGENTGKNFVDKFTYNHAIYRAKKKRPDETIEKYRLFNNMLSSQPMAFNLFCPFMQMIKKGKGAAVTNIFKAIFPDKHIGEVTDVGLEFLPEKKEDYLNDRTAMDAIVRYNDTDGKPAFIAIETKYTDVLGENTGSANAYYDKWIKQIAMFMPDTEAELIKSVETVKAIKAEKDENKKKALKQELKSMKIVTQIYRNFLLTECYGIVDKFNRCYSVVLSPYHHPTTEHEVASLKNELKPEYQYKISAISLEEFIQKTLLVCPEEDKAPFEYFRDRYLKI